MITPMTEEGSVSLRSLAEARGSLWIGAAVDGEALEKDAVYREVLAREFNLVTPENALKFPLTQPRPGEFTFDAADRIVAFASEHRMVVRGHTLVWHNVLPEWVQALSPDSAVWRAMVREHILTLTRRYRGKMAAWDVVNEALTDAGALRDTPFLRALGPEYIAQAFRWAHEGDPDAKLFYNDYSADAWGRKSNAVYRLVEELRAEGVPIHGVGLQMHVCLWAVPRSCLVAMNMRRFNQLGVDVHVTEMDVRMKLPATEDDLREQARVYERIVKVCLDARSCPAFVTWGVSDAYSWVPQAFPGTGAALLFDRDHRPKPAYFAVRDALAARL